MKIIWNLLIAVIALLAIASGVAKMALMQQEVDVFGRYGFIDPILVAFGAFQFAGGVFLAFRKTRTIGAAVIALSFLASLVVLLLDGNVPMAVMTAVVTTAVVAVMVRGRGQDGAAP